MGQHSYELSDFAEYNGGQMGSWLSSFMKCGKTKCPKTTLGRDEIVGQIGLQVSQALQSMGKMATPANIKTESQKVLDSFNAYDTVMTDPSAVVNVVNTIVNTLMSGNKVTAIPGVAPPVTTPVMNPGPALPVAMGGVSQQTLIYGGLGLAALMLLTRR